jgi:enoyl-CoA hydratase
VTDQVLVEVASGIATVTLNRPEARNALTGPLIEELAATLGRLDGDDGVDVVVLTATDPVFCAGLDLKELEPGGTLDISSLTQAGDPWPRLATPLIGAINGAAVTGGLELALRCDVLVASERARFGDTHARVGILPFWGLTWALPRAVGPRTATLMSLTGNFLSAEDALRVGLVAAVVPHEELLATAHRLAADIASADQGAVRALLRAYRETAELDGADAAAAEQRRALDWQGTGFDAERFARNRAAITERGRAQSS